MFEVTCLDTDGNLITNLTQWDLNRTLMIKDTGLDVAPEFHFCNRNSKEALRVLSTLNDGTLFVKIPNVLLQEGMTIIAYLYAYESEISGKTMTVIRIPVRPRPKPSDYTYIENIDYITAVNFENRLNETLARFENLEVFAEDGEAATVTFEGNRLSFVLPKGSSGVYVGSGEMPDDCNVQIDPNGETMNIPPIKGVDYWTPEEQEAIKEECILSLSEELAKREQLNPLFANNIEECTDTTKLYVLPDGYIYAYTYSVAYPDIVYETQNGGYWLLMNGTPNWTDEPDFSSMRTNMIPVNPGEVFSYKGCGLYYVYSVYWFDTDGNILSYEQYNGETTFTVPNGASYAQFYTYSGGTDWELEVSLISGTKTYHWASTGHAFISSDYEERVSELENKINILESSTSTALDGKKIVYDGDSICYGAGYEGGYARIIAEKVNGTYENQAVGGARLVTLLDGYSYHSVVDNLENLPTDGDLYCFEGGINDYWTKGTLGTFDYTNFDGELDTTTVCGALETIFRYALNTFVGKPICFIITHKIQGTAYSENSNGDTFKDYHDAMVGICEKYSIPYYDAFLKSGLNGWNTAQNNAYLTGNSTEDPDGCHPNEDGYKRYYVPQLIKLFEQIMPMS